MKVMRTPDHEGVIEFGPCPGISGRACQGHGTAMVDPRSDALRLTILCGACLAYADLTADDPAPGWLDVAELDRVYGMGA